MNKNPSLIGGLILIGLGLLFLLNVFVPVTWPIAITAVGAAMLAWSVQQRERYGESLGMSGVITTTLGLILLYQMQRRTGEAGTSCGRCCSPR